MRHTAIAVLVLLAALPWNASSARGDEFVVAGWNLENLFDTADDPNVEGDEEYTPGSVKHWTKKRLNIKLRNQAGIISKMNCGKGPDILGLCEVENRKVLEMLIKRLKPLGRKYEIVHKDSPSARGIDCAILYDSAVFSLVDSRFHFVKAGHTRDIVEAKLRRNDRELYVFMHHWPSRYNEPPARFQAADTARKRIDEILAADPKADLIHLGDFNDEPADVSIRDHLRALSTAEYLPPGSLFDTTAPIASANEGTIVYNNKWQLFDHIIVSAGMLDDDGFQWKNGSSQRVDYPELLYQPKYSGVIARPSTTYSSDEYHKKGYSDHLPISCIIEQQAAAGVSDPGEFGRP
jgi:endonuclease/exonuclease/phosphatase family metal-dependent hydrolase